MEWRPHYVRHRTINKCYCFSLSTTRRTVTLHTFVNGGSIEWNSGSITIEITNPLIPTPIFGLCSNSSRCASINTQGPVIFDPVAAANTWLVESPQESAFVYTAAQTFGQINQPGAQQNYGPYTTQDPNIINMYTTSCAPLTVTVENCDPTQYYNWCVNDVIVSQSTIHTAGHINAYNVQCANNNNNNNQGK